MAQVSLQTDLSMVLLERKFDPKRSASDVEAASFSTFSLGTISTEGGGMTVPRRLIFLRIVSSSPVSISCVPTSRLLSVLQDQNLHQHRVRCQKCFTSRLKLNTC